MGRESLDVAAAGAGFDETGKRSGASVKPTHVLIVVIVAAVFCAVVGVIVWFAKPEAPPAGPCPAGREHDFAPGAAPWLNLRLPAYTVPLHYDVMLHPNFYDGGALFSGEVSVDVLIKMSTNYLLIHYKQMTVDQAATRVVDVANASRTYAVVDQFAFDDNQFWIVKTRELIAERSTVRLTLRFGGSLTNGIVGLYKSSYFNGVTNQTRFLATSKFEPVDARKAFPCFDEPNLKATFTVRLRHKSDYTALSNMPVDKVVSVPGAADLSETTFKKSVMMSTYLVCFIVCDFDFKEEALMSGKKFRVYATPDKKDQTDYSLSVGVNVTNYYEEYFGLDYPLPKQDMIAIPDFVSGAMEHWGLITYRETNLLYLEGQSSAINKQRVASVVAHELAHQWFGNIVTMDWWDDLWLNEGFASYMEYVGVDHIEKAWNMYGQILVDDVFPVMVIDTKLSSHPIVVDVNRPEQITEVFDSISYSKGAAVIFMLQAVLGENTFRDGLKIYLNKYRYGNARTDDLWNSLTDAAKGELNVKEMMDTWTRQMGFPVVTITMTSTKQLLASQSRFLNDSRTEQRNDSPFGYKWMIPLSYITSTNQTNRTWMSSTGENVSIPFELNDNSQWIKFNRGSTGFYRVNYPKELWERLGKVVQDLSVEDRAGLINDALNLARSGYLNYSVALPFVRYLEKETEYVPWITAISALNYVSKLMEARNENREWQNFTRSLLKSVYSKDLWPTSQKKSHLSELLSESVIRLACGSELELCLLTARKYFNFYHANETEIPASVRRVVYYFAMKDSTESEWNFMWKKYLTAPFAQEKINLLYGLAQTRNVSIINRYLEYCKNESVIRDQDFFTVVTYISGNPEAIDVVWHWVRKEWPYLVARFKIDNRNLGRLIPDVVSGFSTVARLEEVKDFFKKYTEAGAGARGRVTAIEAIESNIAWADKYIADIKRALSSMSG